MKQRILFCNIAWMKYYQGVTEDDTPKRDLGYIREHKMGEEIYNFYKHNDNCVYGYVATKTMADETAENGQKYCRMKIERISSEIQHDNEKGDFVNGVLVVFFAQKTIVGWYKNATVYREMQEEEGNGKKRRYNIEADYDNATLVSVDERYFGLPSGRNKNSRFGFGQAPYWFADKEEDQDFVSLVRKYVDEYPREQYYEDEVLTEGAKKRVFVNVYERDYRARAKCIRKYGTKCQICGFDAAIKYGKNYEGSIEVHHKTPINQIGERYQINPEEDLLPVCPNCHVILHKKVNGTTISIEELKKIVDKNKSL